MRPLALILVLAVPALARAQNPAQFATADGASSVTFGVLAQAFGQRDTAEGRDATDDLCFRRLRFIAGGKVARKIQFFVESDTPYLGYHGAGGWNAPPTIVQDMFVTFAARDELNVDVGLMLVPLSYNTTQSAASLLAIGYGPYSFLASGPTHSQIGRDQGVQARGYLAKKHVEYRAGIFRGLSRVDSTAPPRVAARVVWYPFGAQTGFFYAGTLHGRRRMLGVGASLDHEGQYDAHGADFFAELPVRGSNAVTFQGDYIHYDGRSLFTQLPKQDTWLAEAGYEFGASHIGFYAQVARQDIAAATAADAAAVQAGAIYWLRGHTLNVKGGLGRTMKDRTPAHTQLVFQTQVFIF